MTDGSLAESRNVKLGFPSTESRDEEIRQVLRDYIYHDCEATRLGRYKGFFHVIERARLTRVLERYGVT
jgi:hypothetical protein